MEALFGIVRFLDGKKEKYKISNCADWKEALDALYDVRPRVAMVLIECKKPPTPRLEEFPPQTA